MKYLILDCSTYKNEIAFNYFFYFKYSFRYILNFIIIMTTYVYKCNQQCWFCFKSANTLYKSKEMFNYRQFYTKKEIAFNYFSQIFFQI